MHIFISIFARVLSISALLFGTTFNAFAQSIKQPILNVGDSWTHRVVDDWTGKTKSEFTRTVIGSTGEFIRFNNALKTADTKTGELSSPISSDQTERADFNFIYTSNGKISTRVNFDWPLEVGKKWTYDYFTASSSAIVPSLSPAVFNYKVNAEVVGWEEVQTSVGKFKALKVVHSSSWKSSSTNEGTSVITYWYAPEIKRYIKISNYSFGLDGLPSTRERTELISYTLAK